jgi:general secretion pathway protein G
MNPARGFTLIELIVTLALLGLLATLAMPMLELTRQRQQEQELKAALKDIRQALDAHHQAVREGRIDAAIGDSGYPPGLDTLVKGVPDRTDPNGRLLFFLRRIPRDPFYPDPHAPAADTWNLRSYASPPDAPAPGQDVYDVYSLSDKLGLNGRPYREW